MKAEAFFEDTQIYWEIKADEPGVSEFNFEIEDDKGNIRFFNMNCKKYTRNDTFIQQMKVFRSNVENIKDFSNNKVELERAKRILEICQ